MAGKQAAWTFLEVLTSANTWHSHVQDWAPCSPVEASRLVQANQGDLISLANDVTLGGILGEFFLTVINQCISKNTSFLFWTLSPLHGICGITEALGHADNG
jgi:hypothetical protein